MKLNFTLEGQTQYNIEFIFNKFTGKTSFRVNGEVAKNYHIITAKSHKLIIHEESRQIEIIINMITPKFLAPFKKGWKYVVSINGQEYKTFED